MHDSSLERPWREDAHPALLVGVAHLTSHFFQVLLAPLLPLLMPAYGFGFVEAGFLATVFFAISSGGQALAGFAVDRLGALRMLLVGMGLLVAAGVCLGLAQSYASLVACAAFAGAGNAMFHPADFTILNRRVSPSRLGSAFAMHSLSGNLGWAAGASFMAFFAALAGWHAAGFAAAGLAASVAILLVFQRGQLDCPPTHAPSGTPHASAGVHAFSHLQSGVVWMCFGFFLLSSGAGGVLQNFAPSLLTHVYATSMALGAAALTSLFLGGAAGTVLGAFLSGQTERNERVVALALGTAALVAVLLASGSLPQALLIPAFFVIGCGGGAAAPNRDLLVRRAAATRFGQAAFGRVYGFVYAGLDSGLALGPLLIGGLLDQGHFQGALLAVAAFQAGALAIALAVGRAR